MKAEALINSDGLDTKSCRDGSFHGIRNVLLTIGGTTMSVRRSILGTVAILGSMLMALSAPGVAQADIPVASSAAASWAVPAQISVNETGAATAPTTPRSPNGGSLDEVVYSWTGIGFIGDLRIDSPVPSGSCRSISSYVDGGYRSSANYSSQYARYWEFADVQLNGVFCMGRNKLVAPGTLEDNLGFHANGLGGL